MSIKNEKIENSEVYKDEIRLRSFYISAKEKLYKGNIEDAYRDFLSAESLFGQAYCKFLSGKKDEASVILKYIKDSSPAVNWLLCLINVIDGKKNIIPTYFQIRNFYESDMNLLFLYKNYDYIKKICSELPFLLRYNKEIYKYTARVFMDNEKPKSAVLLLKESIDIFYNDPEVHFMLGEAYYILNDTVQAIEEYKKSNEVTGGYYPAAKKLSEIFNVRN